MGDLVAILLTLVLITDGALYVRALDRLQRAPDAGSGTKEELGSKLRRGRST